MILNTINKFIFIAIPKTASTTVHIAWGHLKHPEPPLYHMKLDECLKQNPQCKDYFKFCFVRNPYERFISTWFNLRDPHAGHTWAKDLLKYSDVNEFCNCFVKSEYASWVHFRPQVDYIMVDSQNGMDFIGRQENFSQDFNTVCNMIGIPTPNTGRYRHTPHKTADNYLTKNSKEIIYNFYKKDFNQLDYEQ